MVPLLAGIGFTFVFILHWIGFKPGKLDPMFPNLFQGEDLDWAYRMVKLKEGYIARQHRYAGMVSAPRLTKPSDDSYYRAGDTGMTIDLFRKSARSC